MELASRPLSRFAERLAAVRATIAEAGRDPSEVAIVAVTKTRTLRDCETALAAGIEVLAENRVAEGLERIAQLPAARWHLIGHLQSNKVRLAAGSFDLIQSVDSVRLAELIAQRAPRQSVLLQVNVSGEAAKHGCAPLDAIEACRKIAGLLPLEGLMGMAPLDGPPEPPFALLARLRSEAQNATGLGLPILSMGMSGDYPAALRAGSTMLRLGRALFG